MKRLRAHILTTTVLAGISISAAPAFAQAAQPTVPDQNQPTNPAAAPPTGPIEANPTPSVSATGKSVTSANDIIVTGSRIPQPNLTSAAPIVTVSTQDIKLSGSTRIDEILNQLPSVATPEGPGLPNPATGTAEVDLRYLGAKRTLTLVDGRRMTPGDPNQGSSGAGDINLIPTSLIKRVEVLTGGASSVYGADAVSGVVNFIMDTNFNGLRLDAQGGFYQHNNNCPSIGGGQTVCDALNAKINAGLVGYDYPKGSVSDGRSIDATATFGAGFDDGRGHVEGYFGYRKQNKTVQSNRDYSACNLAGAGVPACGGSSISAAGNFLVYVPANNAAGGTSTFFTPSGGGNVVQGRSLYNYAPLNNWIRPDIRYTAGLFAHYDIDPAIKPYLEFMFMDDKTQSQVAPSGSFGNVFTINCDNPFMSAQTQSVICSPTNVVNGNLGSFPLNSVTNPGGTPKTFIDSGGNSYQEGFFQIFRRNVEGGPRQANFSHTTYRGVLGTQGDLSNVFSYDAYYQYGRTKYLQVFENDVSVTRLNRSVNVVNVDASGHVVPVGTAGSVIECRSVLDGSDPSCVPFNYFGTPSAAAVKYVGAVGVDPGETSEQIANVNFTGKLGEAGIQTPWANNGIGINAGWEYRREQMSLTPDEEFQTGDLAGQGAPTLTNSGSFHVNELFAEVEIPIVEHNFIDDLSLAAGYRKSYYATEAGRKYNTDTYKLSAEFAPIADVRFRASYNRAVRAPNVLELFTQQHVALDGSTDPCAGKILTATDYGCIAQFQAAGIANPIGRSTASNPSEQYNGLLGGNPDLVPERATTKTAGVVLRPRFLPQFAFTADYWNIDLKGAIQGFGADAVLADCVGTSTAATIAPTCALIHRDGGGSLWLVPSGPGAGYVVDTPTNVGRIKTDGFDFTSAYAHRFGGIGNFSLSFLGTYLRHYKVNNGLSPTYDCAGFYGSTCSGNVSRGSNSPMPKWRHTMRATLQMPFGLGVSVNWRHVGPVRFEHESTDAVLNGPDITLNSHVKAQEYFDLAATYTLLDSVNLRAGVNNVFDRNPPIIVTTQGACSASGCAGNTYPGTWDYLGRFIYAGVTVDFKHHPAPTPPPPAPPPPPPPPQATTTCPDGLIIIAGQACPAPPAPPPPPPPPAPTPERGS
jgi:iron complex outermembrane receptor protein